MMFIEGLKVIRTDDESYSVIDARGRVLGGIVRYWVPAGLGPSVVKRFRSFGEDFGTLREAVREFTKIRGVRLFDAKGDAEEPTFKGLTRNHVELRDPSGVVRARTKTLASAHRMTRRSGKAALSVSKPQRMRRV